MTRADAAAGRSIALRFFWNSRAKRRPDATGYKGFYYHFLDMRSGKRVWQSELSLIDTTLLLAGILTASRLFYRDDRGAKPKFATLADTLYRRIDWQWAQNGKADGLARMEAGMRIPALRLGGL